MPEIVILSAPDLSGKYQPEILKIRRGLLMLFGYYKLEFIHPHPSGAKLINEGKWHMTEPYWQKPTVAKKIIKNRVPRWRNRGFFETPRAAINKIKESK